MDPDDLNLKDIEIELEEVTPDFVPPADEELEDVKTEAPEAPTLPDEEVDEEELREAAPKRAAKEEDETDEDAAPDVLARAEAAERRARQIEAEAIWREGQAQAELYKGKKAQADISIGLVGREIDHLYSLLAKARDDGDTANEIAVQRQIAQAENIRSEIERARASYPDPEQLLNQYRQQAIAARDAPITNNATTVGAGLRSNNPLAIQWAKLNPWMQSNEKANKFVLDQSAAMSAEGWDSTTRGYYAELSRRIALQYPALKVAKLQASKKAVAPNGRKATVAPMRPAASSTSGATAQSKSHYVLTATEQQTMRRLKLDPNNKEHQRYWARQRLDSAQRGAN